VPTLTLSPMVFDSRMLTLLPVWKWLPMTLPGVRPDHGAVADDRRQLAVGGAARRHADQREVLDGRAGAELHVLIDPRRGAHDATPSLHFFGLNRSWTSMFVSIDS
jgi:hypothetical protein